jgi:predicted 2-oxoglutarate/Fe(II)-dependent dioxygenase YbiX
MNAGAGEPAEVLDESGGRRATVIEIDQSTLTELERRIEATRPELEAHFGCSLGELEGAGLLRYRSGDGYGRHRDAGAAASWPDAERRLISIVVFLNSAAPGVAHGFSGGALRLWDGSTATELVPEQGSLVAFPSETLHEVCAVTAGVRDVIVDWFYRPSTTTVST